MLMCSSNPYSKMVSTRDKAQMTAARGSFLMSQRLQPINPVAEMLLIHVLSSLLSILVNVPALSIQFWLLTTHLYLPSMVNKGKTTYNIKNIYNDNGKWWQYQQLKNCKYHCYFCFKSALAGSITTSEEQTKMK